MAPEQVDRDECPPHPALAGRPAQRNERQRQRQVENHDRVGNEQSPKRQADGEGCKVPEGHPCHECGRKPQERTGRGHQRPVFCSRTKSSSDQVSQRLVGSKPARSIAEVASATEP